MIVFQLFYFNSFVTVPFEIRVMKREHFNRWYNLSAYYWALTIINIPLQVGFSDKFFNVTTNIYITAHLIKYFYYYTLDFYHKTIKLF